MYQCDRQKLVIIGHFFPFIPRQKKSEFWKNEKTCWRYYHFTYLYQKRQSYEVRFLKYIVRLNCHFGPFLSFFPTNNLENQVWRNEKLIWRYKKITIIWCILPEIWSVTIFCHFGPFFALLPHYWPWKLKFGKNVKKPLEILFYYICVL